MLLIISQSLEKKVIFVPVFLIFLRLESSIVAFFVKFASIDAFFV